MEKTIQLAPLAEIGNGKAYITDDRVSIEVSGINGSMKAWLTGGEAVPIGNIVSGKLVKNIDTQGHSGILITQSGRQLLYGKFEENNDDEEEAAPRSNNWKKITERKFPSLSAPVKYVLSNRSVYDNFKKNGYYLFRNEGDICYIAFLCESENENPFSTFEEHGVLCKNYRIIGIDLKNNKLFSPEGINV